MYQPEKSAAVSQQDTVPMFIGEQHGDAAVELTDERAITSGFNERMIALEERVGNLEQQGER